ncbi:unnamed protein product [Amoebophrya sp. A25]|nr:unnamed protein product [Amoebophrya sp. A25]|eukprot:GSA25T00020666001.1
MKHVHKEFFDTTALAKLVVAHLVQSNLASLSICLIKMKLFLVGNSYLYYHNLQHLLREFRSEQKQPSKAANEKLTRILQLTEGGKSLADLADDFVAILNGGFDPDAIILQDFSTGPSNAEHRRKICDVLKTKYVPALTKWLEMDRQVGDEQEASSRSGAASSSTSRIQDTSKKYNKRVFFYCTHARAQYMLETAELRARYNCADFRSTSEKQMGEALEQGYLEYISVCRGRGIPAILIPVGRAWFEFREKIKRDAIAEELEKERLKAEAIEAELQRKREKVGAPRSSRPGTANSAAGGTATSGFSSSSTARQIQEVEDQLQLQEESRFKFNPDSLFHDDSRAHPSVLGSFFIALCLWKALFRVEKVNCSSAMCTLGYNCGVLLDLDSPDDTIMGSTEIQMKKRKTSTNMGNKVEPPVPVPPTESSKAKATIDVQSTKSFQLGSLHPSVFKKKVDALKVFINPSKTEDDGSTVGQNAFQMIRDYLDAHIVFGHSESMVASFHVRTTS